MKIKPGDKFCPKCGIQSKTTADESKEIGKKLLFVILSIVFIILISLVYFVVYTLIGVNFIIEKLPDDMQSGMMQLIFLISFVSSFLTLIPIYKIIKKRRKKINIKMK